MPVPISPEISAGPKLSRIDRTIQQLSSAVYVPHSDLVIECWRTAEPVGYSERTSGEHLQLNVGDIWGELWDCAWFHMTGSYNTSNADGETVLLIDLGGEGLVVDGNGDALQGITSIRSTFDYSLGRPGKRVVPVSILKLADGKIDVWLDAGCNDLFGSLPNSGRIEEACVAVRNTDIHALCFDFEVLRELYDQLPPGSARRARILQSLYDASLILSRGINDERCADAQAVITPEIAKRGGDPSVTISAVGHAHIDLAWLWPLRETIRKGARTFSTVLRMMEKYPDYVFGASQPQLYQWVKDYYPVLYSQIKARVAEGRWEIQGAMWVEPDANVPSGESLVRQILLGTRFFRDEFGVDVKNLWMPDVFGYSGSLPQILKKSGIDYFLTQKLSWSAFNTHPHHTFHWEGIDGSQVLVHMPPEATYNSSAAPRAIAKAESQYIDSDVSDRCLVLFGIGDGGGGPGEEHLERLLREKNLSGLSPVVQEHAAVFFDRLQKSSDAYAVWRGELYLEKHQGTLTSQARNKRFNRKIEIALRELELSAVQAWRNNRTPYPREALDRIWKEVLLLQFHDILPGSSITRVYDESLARYETLLNEVISLTDQYDQEWVPNNPRSVPVLNSLGWHRSEFITHDGAWLKANVPALSLSTIHPDQIYETEVKASDTNLENEILRVTFDSSGNITSIFDKEFNREVLREGGIGNDIVVYRDEGDAWDFSTDYMSVQPARCAVSVSKARVDGPAGIVEQTRTMGQSSINQEIRLLSGSRRIDFITRVDWRERSSMLRTRFAVDVNAVSAQCDIQFGSIERPTTQNTSWDSAKSEICAHKWVDISDAGYGVAILNDCKYGHSVHGRNLDLNLLRASSWPDPVADCAEHQFTYSLFPHAGSYQGGGVVQEAYALNHPLRIVSGSCATDVILEALIGELPDNIILETVKLAEESDDVILRLYESHGKRTRFTAVFASDIHSVFEANLIEKNGARVPFANGVAQLTLQAFEIVTLKLSMK